jgi:elongation factor P
MYETSDFRKGLYIEFEGVPFQIVDFQHVKPGKGNAFTRTRLKNLLNHNVQEKTFKSGERVGEPNLERKQMQFLYKDQDGYQFMDLGAYDQVHFDQETIGEYGNYLIENLEIEVLYYKGKPIGLQLPTFVNLKITYCEPGVKGDTASGGSKPATLETGLTVNVPFHIKQGDVLKIDTRTGEYVEKVK